MKIAVLNYSGNVGKTTIAKHLLLPRVPGSQWIPVESTNTGGDEQLNIRGRHFSDVLREVHALESAVVDIGSSNIEQAFEQLRKLGDAHEDFDFFVVPTVPTEKQQSDTLKLVADLLEMGVAKSKIRIVFNQVTSDQDASRTFARTIQLLRSTGLDVSLGAVIHDSEVFAMIGKDQTLLQATAPDRDIKAEIAKTSSPDERRMLADELLASRLAKVVIKELDSVFAALFPPNSSAHSA